MSDHRRCRFSASDGVLELAGPPAALRSLGRLLRQHAEPCEVPITGRSVAQEVTSGPLLVSLRDMTTLHFCGSPAHLNIIWDALDDVADDAETADERHVNRHQHIEVISTRLVAVLEMCEHERGSSYVADLPWRLGDMLEYTPALGQQSETALADTPH